MIDGASHLPRCWVRAGLGTLDLDHSTLTCCHWIFRTGLVLDWGNTGSAVTTHTPDLLQVAPGQDRRSRPGPDDGAVTVLSPA